jgi:hypothetical protein
MRPHVYRSCHDGRRLAVPGGGGLIQVAGEAAGKTWAAGAVGIYRTVCSLFSSGEIGRIPHFAGFLLDEIKSSRSK